MMRQVADPGHSEGARWARMRVHMVTNDIMATLGYSSKLNAEWAFLRMLRDEGRKAFDTFLAAHRDGIGQRSTVNLDVLLEGV
jgi:NTE family protein